MNNKELFNMWADNYDNDVRLYEESSSYPFAGYKSNLNRIFNLVMKKKYSKVLDIGFGTAVLTSKLYENNHDITGIDFSERMLEIGQKKMPSASLYLSDFRKGITIKIKSRFDYVLLTYSIHHLSFTEKVKLLRELKNYLNEDGLIIIGDVLFETSSDLSKSKEKHSRIWDDEEFYIVIEELTEEISNDYQVSYHIETHCSGIVILRRLAQT
ncbi:class I SAM-dependent methyltransferase [Mycoplasmatota bacterium zrk1]